ncbi:hypothetical protein FAZ19_07085 [Sphingobacterium alkalisoli]|uniref:Uncharacterized protein n=1 Tax=Sphingobacterium alkalisoli TaxID=1874115 RepID=A0A4U0H4R2_9SPHI|nr:hypothetical protein [Sphingobacterium alkalisoli]TJY66675.1 hypothetical protein FAZ19_07085 [Sphingobacterium alkalisoli]GGH14883.1 hypothetical protein GCM10011418_16170 [Sphingobacterium alkalisoli]
MEFSELEKNWHMFSKRLEENTRINKRILNEMMTRKPRHRINLLRWESGIRMLLTVALCVFLIIRFDTTILSLRGVMLVFLVLFAGLAHYFDTFQLFKLLGKLDFSKPVKHINILFLAYEQKKLWVKKLTTMSYVLLIPLLAYVLFTNGNALLKGGIEFILTIVIVAVGGLLFSRSRHRLIQSQIRKLREEMEELNESERSE